MKTTPTTGGEAVAEQLPIVAYREFTDFGGWYTYPHAGAPDGRHCENEPLTPHAPAQAALDELRDDRDSWRDQASARAADAVQFANERDELRREVEALRADAARYRWLRDVSVPPHNFYISVPVEFEGVRYTPAEVDAAIDTARASTDEGKA